MKKRICHTADVLIAGGSYAGLCAALAARRQGAEVLVADKAVSPDGGCARFAAGDILCPMPEDGLDVWVDALLKNGRGLADEIWLRESLPMAWPLLEEQISIGAYVRRGEEEKPARRRGRGGLRSATMDMRAALAALHRECRRLGVRFLERTPLLELAEQDGAIRGAVGLDVRTGALVAVAADSVVLASGGCGFCGSYFGMGTATGDGIAMAARKGALLESMEFSNKMQTTHRDYNLCGTNRLTSMGGVFRNASGEAFMARCAPEQRDAAPLDAVARAFWTEEQAGRGPLFLDLSAVPEQERMRTQELMPHLGALLNQVDGEFYSVQPWKVSFTGSVGASPAGLWVDEQQATSLSGLWAAGDAASRTNLLGASVGMGGAGLFYALVSGKRAGEAAARASASIKKRQNHVRRETFPLRMAEEERVLEKSGSPAAPLEELQEILFPLECCFMKQEDRLRDALKRLETLENSRDAAEEEDPHRILKRRQADNMLLLAKAFLTASLSRRETRGGHFREDYPDADPKLEHKRLLLQKRQDQFDVTWRDTAP